jgi:PfaB family protein
MQPVAIVGLSCLFPGAHGPAAFWQNLLAGVDATAELTSAEIGADPALFFDPQGRHSDGFVYQRGGFVRDFVFDPAGFALPSEQLHGLDPLYQWALHVARESLADSGHLGHAALLARCGLVLGNLSFPTRSSQRLIGPLYAALVADALRELLDDEPVTLDALPPLNGVAPVALNSHVAGAPADLAARALGLGGPHFALDAACASSLYALKLACEYLAAGKADLMLAGAVSCADPLFVHTGFSIFQAYPTEGASRPLDRNSQGLTSGEGAGMLVLKRYADALRDGDRIYGLVRGIGLSNDGTGKHLLVPNPKGQQLAFERAYAAADVSPARVAYVECHATGTPVGDIVELNSMERFFGAYGHAPLIGSVKSNFGHLLTAAGMAGMIKVLLSMNAGRIPPTIGLREPLVSQSGSIGGAGTVRAPQDWPAQDGPRRAAVSAFGFGGTNAHVVLEQPVGLPANEPAALELPALAITGMDACFGPYQTLDEFDRALYTGESAVGPLPALRWHGFAQQLELLREHGLATGAAPAGAYLEGFAFDFLQARIPPDAADQPLPQQLLLLRVADRALRDAKIQSGSNVAVLVAMEMDPAIHQLRGRQDLVWQLPQFFARAGIAPAPEEAAQLERLLKDALHQPAQINQYISFIGNIMACRVAALWDLNGPAFTISADESGVFRALEVARLMLARREVEAVVVAAVDLAGGLERVLLDVPLNGADTPVGEGAGALVLRRADDVQGGHIYAQIEAVELAGAPVAETAIATAARQALNAAGITAADIGYLELALPRQPGAISGLAQVYAPVHSVPLQAVGTVAANIGRAGAAAGVAALIKTALCIDGRYLPACPDWDMFAEAEFAAATALYVPDSARPWLRRQNARRRAVVSSLGSDGCAANVILAEPPQAQPQPAAFVRRSRLRLLPLFADSRDELSGRLAELATALADGRPLLNLVRQALLAAQARPAARYALVLLARDSAELQREIDLARTGLAAAFEHGTDWETPLGSCFSARPLAAQGRLAFVFPGAFSAYPGLGRELWQLFPDLHQRLAGLGGDLPAIIDERRIYPRWRRPPGRAELDAARGALRSDTLGWMQSSLMFTVLYTAVLREHFCVQPQAAFGYSMGESSMLLAMGVWPASAASLRQLQQSPLFTRRLAGRREAAREYLGVPPDADVDFWGNFTLRVPLEQAQARLQGERYAFLALINTPQEVVVSGVPAVVQQVAADLGCEAYRAPFENVIHCPAMHSEYALMLELHALPTTPVPGVTFYTAAGKQPMHLERDWIARAISSASSGTVDFPGLVQQVYHDGARIFVEVGPANVCSRWIGSILAGQPHRVLPVNRQGVEESASLLALLARLISHRVALDLAPLLPAEAEPPAKRSLIKVIRPGGQDVRAAMVTAENRSLLQTVCARRRFVAPVAVAATAIVPAAPPVAVQAPPPTAAGNGQNGHAGLHCALPSLPRAKERTTVIEEVPAPMISPPQADTAALIAQHRALLAERRAALHRHAADLCAPQSPPAPRPAELIWDQADLLEFAGGKIAPVFGREYAAIDQYARRVRLPTPPYLLVSRVTKLAAECGNFRPSTITTEYDIPLKAWYSVDAQTPIAVAVESGQCDLLLISYLGIDFECRGERVYRLLDCTLTFLDELPKDGETLRYDISINSFARSGETLLFFFSYECFVGERMILKMDGGCAGFFTDGELAEGRGVVDSRADIEQRQAAVRRMFVPPLQSARRALSTADMEFLIAGDIAGCFGPAYDQGGRNASLRLPARAMLMISRVASIDPQGGDWGLGLVIGEQDLTPESWFFPCHFVDDQVMAGSLMAEGCCQLLQIYMLFLGLQSYTFDARFQPIPGVPQEVRCRGQVTPMTGKLIYRLEVTALGIEPQPYAYANIDVILDGRIVVRFKDLVLQLREKNPRLVPPAKLEHPVPATPPAYDEAMIQQFTTGSLTACFGPDYAIYEGRRAPRNPNGDLQLISRVLHVEGRRGELAPGSNLVAEYDVPANPWYCYKNSYPTAPYSVLMEIALQPCGFLTSALGSTLSDPQQDFYFRNLDGSGHLLREVDIRGKRITSRARLLSSNAMAGVIIQKFDFALAIDGEDFYVGDAAFGFFSATMLANQTGLDHGRTTRPWFETSGVGSGQELRLADPAHPLFRASPERPHARLAGDQLQFLDRLLVFPQSGRHGLGYVFGEKKVDPTNWFYACHFYSDPVMPGSLGVQAILEALEAYVLHCGLDRGMRSPRFGPIADQCTVWKYRGQIIPRSGLMTLEAHITGIERRGAQLVLLADASLWRDDLRIYEVTGLGLALSETGAD